MSKGKSLAEARLHPQKFKNYLTARVPMSQYVAKLPNTTANRILFGAAKPNAIVTTETSKQERNFKLRSTTCQPGNLDLGYWCMSKPVTIKS
jgi:hypothetical protein